MREKYRMQERRQGLEAVRLLARDPKPESSLQTCGAQGTTGTKSRQASMFSGGDGTNSKTAPKW